jgi:hypothetical protein
MIEPTKPQPDVVVMDLIAHYQIALGQARRYGNSRAAAALEFRLASLQRSDTPDPRQLNLRLVVDNAVGFV